MTKYTNNVIKTSIPQAIKQKLSERKRLPKSNMRITTNEKTARVKSLNTEIKAYFINAKSKSIRQCIVPGNTASLWTAVKTAKNVNTSDLSNKMYLEETEVNSEELADKFATFFRNKISKILEKIEIDYQVYNGEKKSLMKRKCSWIRTDKGMHYITENKKY